MPEYLEDKITTLTAQDVYDALCVAWKAYFGEEAEHSPILVLMAQSALETGRWKALHWYNFGNCKSVKGDSRDWTSYVCDEYINGKRVWFLKGTPGSMFRAYKTKELGAVDYLDLLYRRYHPCWLHVLSGNPENFVMSIKSMGYFTADLQKYKVAVASLFNEYTKTLVKKDVPVFTFEEQEQIDNLVKITLDESIKSSIII